MSVRSRRSARSTFSINPALAAALAVLAPLALPVASARAPSAPADSAAIDPVAEVENSRFQFEGQVNANAVYVRSGPSENDYATMKLDKGASVTVLGIRFGWLKIIPPEGSFCYVAKAYVEKRGDGKIGRVTNALNVRVGSQLLPMKTKVAARLEPGQDVQIVGEQDEYFKIKPPAGVYLYVAQQFVDPVKQVEVPGITAAARAGDSTTPVNPSTPVAPPAATATPPVTAERPADQPVSGAPGESAVAATPAPASESPVAVAPQVDQPSNSAAAIEAPVAAVDDTPSPSADPATPAADPTPIAAAPAPATQPAVAVELEFDRLEAQLRQIANLPIQQQPIPELLAGYQKVAAAATLPESMRRQAEYRIATLKVHNENRELILAHERDQNSRQQALVALQREGDELMERVKSTGIVYYTAVGTLRPSSLQFGQGTLYRLTDPVTGRTLVYIKTEDPRLVSMVGLFVGVQGQIVDDPNWKLKWIAPTNLEPVDQRRVNQNIAAQIIPPSLMPGGALTGGGAE